MQNLFPRSSLSVKCVCFMEYSPSFNLSLDYQNRIPCPLTQVLFQLIDVGGGKGEAFPPGMAISGIVLFINLASGSE